MISIEHVTRACLCSRLKCDYDYNFFKCLSISELNTKVDLRKKSNAINALSINN